MFTRLIRNLVCVINSFILWQNNILLDECTTFLFINPLKDAWVSFTFLAIVNNAIMNVGIQVSV